MLLPFGPAVRFPAFCPTSMATVSAFMGVANSAGNRLYWTRSGYNPRLVILRLQSSRCSFNLARAWLCSIIFLRTSPTSPFSLCLE